MTISEKLRHFLFVLNGDILGADISALLHKFCNDFCSVRLKSAAFEAAFDAISNWRRKTNETYIENQEFSGIFGIIYYCRCDAGIFPNQKASFETQTGREEKSCRSSARLYSDNGDHDPLANE